MHVRSRRRRSGDLRPRLGPRTPTAAGSRRWSPKRARSAFASACSWTPTRRRWRRRSAVGADRIELYTEPYAQAFATAAQARSLAEFRAAAEAAQRLGLGVNAGHDLNRANLGAFLAAVPGVLEVSIGHAFIADALELGMAETVRAYRRVIDSAAASR